MGFISSLFSTSKPSLGHNRRDVLLRRLPLISESNIDSDANAEKERFVSDAEIQTLKYCFTLAPNTGDKRILGKIENGDLCLRPASIQAFKVILAEKGLMDNPVIAGLLRWIETDSKRYFRFRL